MDKENMASIKGGVHAIEKNEIDRNSKMAARGRKQKASLL
jgi:hypothetical protein